jgi:hypothetical protein
MTDPKNSGPKQADGQFQKGVSGNPAGKPKGALNHATRAAQALLDGEADAITRKCIEMALKGDVTAIKLCMERLVPVRKDRPIEFCLGEIATASDLAAASIRLLEAVASGNVTPDEAEAVIRVMGGVGKAIELGQIEARIAALEALGRTGSSRLRA